MDIPLFGDSPNKRRREINLGGSHTATSHNDILQEAKLRRLQRNDLKRRQDSAIRIQHWWRGRIALNAVRQQLRHTYEQDITSLTGLRSLVLLGQDEDALGRWSSLVSSSRKGAFHPRIQITYPNLDLLQMSSHRATPAPSFSSRGSPSCSSSPSPSIQGTSQR